jgi:hypothetical protein
MKKRSMKCGIQAKDGYSTDAGLERLGLGIRSDARLIPNLGSVASVACCGFGACVGLSKANQRGSGQSKQAGPT